jgi:hypothetical protein
MFDAAGAQVSMFWLAASIEGNPLPPQVAFDPSDGRFYQTHKMRTFPLSGTVRGVPDRIALRVRLELIGLDVLDDLIASGDLDRQLRGAMPRFTMGPAVEWT